MMLARSQRPTEDTRARGAERALLAAERVAQLACQPKRWGKQKQPAFAKATAGNLRLTQSEDWSGKRDSNPRLRPWQGRTLPLSYSRSPWRPPVQRNHALLRRAMLQTAPTVRPKSLEYHTPSTTGKAGSSPSTPAHASKAFGYTVITADSPTPSMATTSNRHGTFVRLLRAR